MAKVIDLSEVSTDGWVRMRHFEYALAAHAAAAMSSMDAKDGEAVKVLVRDKYILRDAPREGPNTVWLPERGEHGSRYGHHDPDAPSATGQLVGVWVQEVAARMGLAVEVALVRYCRACGAWADSGSYGSHQCPTCVGELEVVFSPRGEGLRLAPVYWCPTHGAFPLEILEEDAGDMKPISGKVKKPCPCGREKTPSAYMNM